MAPSRPVSAESSDPDAAESHPLIIVQVTGRIRVVRSRVLAGEWLIQRKVSEKDGAVDAWRTASRHRDRAGLITVMAERLGPALREDDKRVLLRLPDRCPPRG